MQEEVSHHDAGQHRRLDKTVTATTGAATRANTALDCTESPSRSSEDSRIAFTHRWQQLGERHMRERRQRRHGVTGTLGDKSSKVAQLSVDVHRSFGKDTAVIQDASRSGSLARMSGHLETAMDIDSDVEYHTSSENFTDNEHGDAQSPEQHIRVAAA